MAYDLLDRALLVADQLEEKLDEGGEPDTGTSEGEEKPDEEPEEEDEEAVG